MKVYITYKIPEAGLKRLEGKCCFNFNEQDKLLSKKELSARIADVDALICLLEDRIDRDVLDVGEKLRIVSNFAVGYNNIDVDYASQRGIMVTNTPGVLTETTADLAWALLMSVARRVVEGDSFVRSGKFSGWRPELMLGSDVHGKALGVVGLGRIGQAMALRAAGFNMKVLYYSPSPLDRENELSEWATYVDLETLLSRSDFVTLHVPLNDSTYHLIDESKLLLMKPTAFLINTSRGPVLDERALVKSLKEGIIAGAALDVYENEPALSPGLSELSNVVLVPHVGSATHQTRNRMAEMAAENVIAVLSGEIPPNLVNKELLQQRSARL